MAKSKYDEDWLIEGFASPEAYAEEVAKKAAAAGASLDAVIASADADIELLGRDRLRERLKAAARELAARRMEALALYEPLPHQEAFHRSACRQRVIRGSNRSGKTVAAAVELARAVTGRDPYKKYPLKDGRAYVVGLDLLHVSQVFWRKLFRAGAFRMVRDQFNGQWRAYRPWDPADKARKKESKPAPPLIPRRFVADIAWEDRAKGIPRMIRLASGWEVTFFSSKAKPPQGMDLDYVWFDEELEDEEWYPEMVMRLIDRNGHFVWSATPQAGNDQLLALSEKADRERGKPAPAVEEFIALLDENPHIDEEAKRQVEDLLDDDQKAVRIGGEFAAAAWKVFPDFRPQAHVRDVPEVPTHWTRYAAVDPGRQICCVLFLAVPPPGEQPFEAVLYDELYIPHCSAALFGQRMGQKAQGQAFEAFLIDGHMGRQTEMGSGLTVESQYARALARHRVRSRRTGSGFAHGTDDVAGGIELCRDYLRTGESGDCPRLVVRAGTCPNFRDEIKRYRYKRQGRVVTDQPETRGNVHAMACLRYLAGYRPRYHRPTEGDRRPTGVYAKFLANRKRKQAAGDVVRLGPDRSEA